MSAGVFIARQPLLNKQRAITVNRLIVHARGAAPGHFAAQNGLREVWPAQHTTFVGLGGVMPDAYSPPR